MNKSIVLNNNVKIAFDGKTYFVKFLEAQAGWFPVNEILFNVETGSHIIKSVYGVNAGKRQQIKNKKGQNCAIITGLSFKDDGLTIDNRIKLYNSSVVTKINNYYNNDILEEAHKINNDYDLVCNVLALNLDKEHLNKILDIYPSIKAMLKI